MDISNRLTAIRKSLGFNQIPFAKKIGVSQSAYANYERGATVIPLTFAANICRDYGISAEWFLLGKGAMETSNLNQIVENAVFATRKFVSENSLPIPPEKEARLVRFLVEEMSKDVDFGVDDQNRFLNAAK